MAPMDIRLHRYGHMVQEYYVARLREERAKLKEARAKLRTRADALKLQKAIRKSIRNAFGPLPKRTPLNVRVTGTIRHRRFTIEKIVYESRPGFPVTANLYIPKALKGRAPAVLGTCGHSAEGKAAVSYQSFARGLAMKGFVCLIYDPISQGERVQYPNREGRCRLGLCPEHNMIGNQQMLTGEFFGTWRAWDGIRGLDVLLARDEVDPKRVGVTGISGGGTLTSWLVALDDRFAMAAPGCFTTTLLSNMENELPADVEQIPPAILALGVDEHDVFIPFAPRPLILLAQSKDFFDVRGTRECYEELRRVYRLLGAEKNVQLHVAEGTHGYSQELREAMYGFFGAHAGLDVKSREPRLKLDPEKTLHATRTGLVARERAKLVVDFTAEQAGALARKRKRLDAKTLRRLLAKALALPKRDDAPHHRFLAPHTIGRLRFQNFAVETEPGIQAIVTLVDPKGWRVPPPKGKRCELLMPHLASYDDLLLGKVNRRLRGDVPVFAVDPRGIGQSMAIGCQNPLEFFDPYDSDYLFHSYGLMLDEPYMGRRVHDVLSTLDWLASLGYDDIHLVGRGMGALLALFAAVLDERPARVTLVNSLLSYHELTQTETYRWPASSLVRGALKSFDLPDCYRALGDRLHLVDPWDAGMNTIKPVEAKRRAKELGVRMG